MLVFNFSASTRYLIFWNGLVLSAIPWVVISYYHFIRAYDHKRGGIGIVIGYIIVILLLALNLKGVIVKNAYFQYGSLVHDIGHWDLVLAAVVIPYLAVIFTILLKRYSRSDDAIDRNKTAYLMIGFFILLVLSYITPFSPALRGYPIDHVGNLVNALIIAYTISRFSLLDIRFVIRRGLAFTLVLVPILGLYVGGLILIFKIYPYIPFISIVLITIILTVFLVLISIPLRRPIQEIVDRFFYRETYDHRRTLMSFTGKMGNILNLEQLTQEMLQTLSMAIQISKAVLLFEEERSGYFVTRRVYRSGKSEQDEELKLAFDSPVVIWLQKESQVLTMKKIDSAPQFKGLWEAEKDSLHKSDLELFCPLKSHGKLVGILGLSKKSSNHVFSQEDIELVTGLANQAGVIVENAQLYAQAITWSVTDGLTRLYNHRYMHECLDKEIARCRRFGTIFSIIMIDLDFFKNCNDAYGHIFGDEVLASIGKIIRSSIRTVDYAFRYGGEEFALLLPETAAENAYEVAERIREKIEQNGFNGRASITASLGIATWPTDGEKKEQLLATADKFLYTAKGEGRNRTYPPFGHKKPIFEPTDEGSRAQIIAFKMLSTFAATMDSNDNYTYGHSRNVSQYSVAIAQSLHLSPEKINLIRVGGLLHDLGKLAISDSILRKNGKPDEAEWRQIRSHPEMGVTVLRHVGEMLNIQPMILSHHEHFDGSGYPKGLKGKEIPLEGRILAVADAYDAMTSLRPYRNQKTTQQAIDELKMYSGITFDPEIVEIFCMILQSAADKSGHGE